MMTRLAQLVTVLMVSCAVVIGAVATLQHAAKSDVPLCPGLTIVTAISQVEGDYESIKTVTSADTTKLVLKYSNQQAPELIGGGQRMRKLVVSRVVRVADLLSATLYEQMFGTNIPDEMPGTTAVGTSTAVLTALKSKGEAALGIFSIPPASIGDTSKLPIESKAHPNIFDYYEMYKLHRVESGPVMIPVIVNDVKTELRAIHATGRSDFYGYNAEFFFLDDEKNPLALKWRLGIGAASGQKAGGDRDSLQVIKIAHRCSATAPAQSWLERALAESGHADVYDIYFSFNSDEIREESESTLQELGNVMRRHPDWKLSIAGHTDGIGGDAPNLDLSKRRAAAVKNALVSRFGVNAGRLTSGGYGKARPVDSNDTAEGRARNRRVELERLP